MIPTAKTFFSCRLMRPDFRIAEAPGGILLAIWTEPTFERGDRGVSGDDYQRYVKGGRERMALIEVAYDEIVEFERQRAERASCEHCAKKLSHVCGGKRRFF